MTKILITGCSKGFGLLFAEYLSKADQKFKVFASARNLQEAQDLINLKNNFDNLEIIELDVLNFEQIDAIAGLMQQEKIDVLINNAGYGLMSNISDLEPEALYLQFATNVFAPIELTRRLLPCFNSDGLIINISSIASYLGLPSFGAYSASKAALNTLSMSLACENASLGLSVIVVEPGPYNTKFRDSVRHLGDANNYQKMRSKLFQTQEDASEVAKLIYKLICQKQKNKLPIYSEIPVGSNSGLLRIASRWLPLEWLVKFIVSQSN